MIMHDADPNNDDALCEVLHCRRLREGLQMDKSKKYYGRIKMEVKELSSRDALAPYVFQESDC